MISVEIVDKPSHGDKVSGYVVMVGNFFDGHYVYGPFDSFDDAEEWAARVVNVDWFVSSIYQPEVADENRS